MKSLLIFLFLAIVRGENEGIWHNLDQNNTFDFFSIREGFLLHSVHFLHDEFYLFEGPYINSGNILKVIFTGHVYDGNKPLSFKFYDKHGTTINELVECNTTILHEDHNPNNFTVQSQDCGVHFRFVFPPQSHDAVTACNVLTPLFIALAFIGLLGCHFMEKNTGYSYTFFGLLLCGFLIRYGTLRGAAWLGTGIFSLVLFGILIFLLCFIAIPVKTCGGTTPKQSNPWVIVVALLTLVITAIIWVTLDLEMMLLVMAFFMIPDIIQTFINNGDERWTASFSILMLMCYLPILFCFKLYSSRTAYLEPDYKLVLICLGVVAAQILLIGIQKKFSRFGLECLTFGRNRMNRLDPVQPVELLQPPAINKENGESLGA